MKIALCRNCGKKFKPRRGKKHCSDTCRYEAWKVTCAPCFYCGMPADTVDHVPPQMARPILIAHGVSRWDFVEVEACHECNSSIGAKALYTLAERKKYIKERIRARYRRILQMPEWSEDQLKELGPGLKDFVAAQAYLALLTRKRLGW